MICLKVTRFSFHKRDAYPRECEDAIAFNHHARRFAVVDGATEGFDSKRWARYLALAWVRNAACDVATAQDAVRQLGARLQSRHKTHSLPWYLQERAEQGAFAAFVGLSIDPSGTWDALAVGDCCLFREGRSHFLAFPLSEPEDFTTRPILVPSLISHDSRLTEYVRQARGVSLVGDCFLLMSDAIACWYLAHAHREEAVRKHLHKLLGEDKRQDLERLVAEEREAKRLRNDDIAILRIEVLSI